MRPIATLLLISTLALSSHVREVAGFTLLAFAEQGKPPTILGRRHCVGGAGITGFECGAAGAAPVRRSGPVALGATHEIRADLCSTDTRTRDRP
jgi:hypothetical protein